MKISEHVYSSCGVTVRLVFGGENVDHATVTSILELAPIDANKTETSGFWELSLPPDPLGDDESERSYAEWRRFLLSRSDKFEKLTELGYSGYLDFKISDDYRNTAYIDSHFSKLAGNLGLAINAWFMPPQPQTKTKQFKGSLVVPQPKNYLGTADEEMFFSCLRNIPAVCSMDEHTEITLHLRDNSLDDESLRALIGLLQRYELDMTCLKSQVTDLNAHWFFDNKKAFWHESVFGKTLTQNTEGTGSLELQEPGS